MNKTFKVVFNKVRGSLMAVNETTCNVKGKGSKTVLTTGLAVATLTVAGSAVAADVITGEYADNHKIVTSNMSQAEVEASWGSAVNGSSLIIKDASFTNNTLLATQGTALTHELRGGAVFSRGTVSITGSSFENNSTLSRSANPNYWAFGGAVSIYGWNGSVTDSRFIGNSADFGGAIGAPNAEWAWQDEGLKISNSYFEKNEALYNGGAITAYERLSITNSQFVENKVSRNDDDGGGAIVLGGHAKVSISGSRFEKNTSASIGGAISTRPVDRNRGATNSYGGAWMDIADSQFIGNSVTGESNTKHYYNRGTGIGGAIYLGMLGEDWTQATEAGSKGFVRPNTITNSVFDSNSASVNGGAIYNEGYLTISGTSQFINNTAGSKGGALYVAYLTTTLDAAASTDTITFSGNKAGTTANDVYLAANSSIKIPDPLPTGFDDKTALVLKGQGTIAFESGIAGETGTFIRSSAANVKISDAASYLGSFTLNRGTTAIAGNKYFGGTVTINGGTLAIEGNTLTLGQSSTTLTNGVLQSAYSNIFTDADTPVLKTGNSMTFTGGVLELSGFNGTYTLADLTALKTALGTSSQTQVSLVDGNLTGDTTLQDIVNNNANVSSETIKATVTQSKVELTSAGTATVGNVVADGAKSMQIGSQGNAVHLTLAGNDQGSELVSGADAALAITVANGSSLHFGQNSSSTGSLTAAVKAKGTVGVNQGHFNATFVDLAETGKLNVGTNGNASLSLENLSGKGAVLVGSNSTNADAADTVGVLNIQKLSMAGGSIFLDPAWYGSETYGDGSVLTVASFGENGLNTHLIVGQNSMAVLGSDKSTAVAYANETGKAYGKDGITAVLHVATPIKVAANGAILVDGSLTTTNNLNVTDQTITLNANSLTIIDTSAIGNNVVFTGANVTLDDQAFMYLTNVTQAGQSISIADSTHSFTGNAASLLTNNKFITLAVDGKTITAKKAAIDTSSEAGQMIDGLYTNGMSASTAAFFEKIGSDTTFASTSDKGIVLTKAGETAVTEFAATAAISGIYNVAYDAQQEFAESINRELSTQARPQSTNVWADVYATCSKADTLYGNTGYSADIYGGVLGADYTASFGGRIGLALTVGTADADSEGTLFKQQNDADFWGLSLYAGHDFSGLNVKADVGYLHSKNDLSGGYSNESVDADAWTVGLRSDFLVYDGALKVLPHFGLRYTHINADDLADRSSDSLNLFEAPVGVTVKGDFAAANWTITPALDVTVAPQLGDNSVESTVAGISTETDVIDHALGKASLGVTATNGNLMMGLDYRFGYGSDNRNNHSLNAHVKYVF